MRRAGTTIHRVGAARRCRPARGRRPHDTTPLRACGRVRLGVAMVVIRGVPLGRTPTGYGVGEQRRPPPAHPGRPYAVAAQRQPLTTNAKSPVAHDTETEALVAHSGRLFAATGQWEYPGPSAFGQVLVKKSQTSPWTVFEQTQSLRVQALDSFPIPSDQGLGPGHSLLVTQAIVAGQSRIQWLLDGANSFSLRNSYVLPTGADIRAFRAHGPGGVWSVYAGVRPTGVLQGTWSPARRTLVFDPQPVLHRRPAGFAGSGDAEGHGLRRLCRSSVLHHQHHALSAERRRSALRHPSLGPGVPGATRSDRTTAGCGASRASRHDGSPSLLLSTEGNGNVYRFDDLPRGQLRHHSEPEPRFGRRRVGADARVPTHPRHPSDAGPTGGTLIPATGRGSIAYVIAAYNNGDFQTVKIGGLDRQVFGFEWGYQGVCPATQKCGPIASGVVHFNASACFAVRTDQGQSPTYTLRCLSGPTLRPSATVSKTDPFGTGLRVHPEHRAVTVQRRADLLRRLRLQLLPRRRHGVGGNVPAPFSQPLRFTERESHMKRLTRSLRRGPRSPLSQVPSPSWRWHSTHVGSFARPAGGLSRKRERRADGALPRGLRYPQNQARHRHRAGEPLVDSYFGTYPGADGIPMAQRRADGLRACPSGWLPSALPRHR